MAPRHQQQTAADAPTDDECETCPSCGEGHATLVENRSDDLDRYCNRCLADKLTERYGSDEQSAVNCVRRSAERRREEAGR